VLNAAENRETRRVQFQKSASLEVELRMPQEQRKVGIKCMLSDCICDKAVYCAMYLVPIKFYSIRKEKKTLMTS